MHVLNSIKKMSLQKVLVLALVALIGSTVSLSAQEEMTDQQLLQTMDFQRFGAYFAATQSEQPSATFTVEIVAERPDGSKSAVVQVSFLVSQTAGFMFRIDYLAPEELAQDVFIVQGDDVFFWNPDLLTPLKVNGRFEVFGDATVAEVVGIFFDGDYTISDRQPTTLPDGSAALLLSLEATREAVAFPRAEVIADAVTLQPVSLRLFDESGDLLHDNTFVAYAELNGAPYFETQLLDNRIVPVNQTQLTMTNIEHVSLTEDYFDPNNLGI
jgi:outer membrane lipoprotein-sorting protein